MDGNQFFGSTLIAMGLLTGSPTELEMGGVCSVGEVNMYVFPFLKGRVEGHKHTMQSMLVNGGY